MSKPPEDEKKVGISQAWAQLASSPASSRATCRGPSPRYIILTVSLPIILSAFLVKFAFPIDTFSPDNPVHVDTFTPTHHETTPQDINQPKREESPYSVHYRPDAIIWSLYLKETEAEDKELVFLWQTGLDSLLVFVS